MALLVVRTYRCWTLCRIMHFVYVLVLIEPLHLPACVYLQMNHLSTYGGERVVGERRRRELQRMPPVAIT